MTSAELLFAYRYRRGPRTVVPQGNTRCSSSAVKTRPGCDTSDSLII